MTCLRNTRSSFVLVVQDDGGWAAAAELTGRPQRAEAVGGGGADERLRSRPGEPVISQAMA